MGLLRIAQTVLPADSDDPYLHGTIAFGLEQCHQLEAAEQWERRVTEMQRQNPWAHHAVAHVLEMQGRVVSAAPHPRTCFAIPRPAL